MYWPRYLVISQESRVESLCYTILSGHTNIIYRPTKIHIFFSVIAIISSHSITSNFITILINHWKPGLDKCLTSSFSAVSTCRGDLRSVNLSKQTESRAQLKHQLPGSMSESRLAELFSLASGNIDIDNLANMARHRSSGQPAVVATLSV